MTPQETNHQKLQISLCCRHRSWSQRNKIKSILAKSFKQISQLLKSKMRWKCLRFQNLCPRINWLIKVSREILFKSTDPQSWELANRTPKQNRALAGNFRQVYPRCQKNKKILRKGMLQKNKRSKFHHLKNKEFSEIFQNTGVLGFWGHTISYKIHNAQDAWS